MQASYSAGLNTELMLKIKEGNNEWTDLEMNYSTSQWQKVENNISLSNYDGKKVQIAFVYKNDKTSGANTWEVWNVKVSAGNEGGSTDSEPTPSGEFTSNINLEGISGTSYYKEKANINGTESDVVKIGTSSKPGSWTTPLAGGETTLTFYAIAWKGTGSTPLTISIENGGSFEDGSNSKEVTVTENAGATGSATSSPYTITLKGDNSELTELKLKDTTSSTTITFSANKRILFFGINLK